MRQQQMTHLINSLPALTHHQRQQLAAALGLLSASSQVSEVIEAPMPSAIAATISAVSTGPSSMINDKDTADPSMPSAPNRFNEE